MKKLLSVLIAVFVLFPAIVLAADFRAPADEDATVTLGKNETAKNLYIAGGTVNVDGVIKGDLVTGGGTVNVNNDVESDLLTGGGTLTIKGNVGKNSRMAGGDIEITGKTAEDLAVAGGTINLGKDAEVGGDLMASAGTINLNNTVKGRAYLAGGTITINGVIDGNVVIRNVTNLTLGDGAKINGNLTYYSPNEASISSGAVVGGKTEYNKVSTTNYKWRSMKPAGIFFSMIMTFLVLIVLVSLFRKFADRAVAEAGKDYLVKIGWGIFVLVAFPVAIIFLCATIIGVKLALLIGILYVLFLLLASFLSPLIIGSHLSKMLKLNSDLSANWISIILGIVALAIIKMIPFAGPLVVAIVFLLALGLISTNVSKVIMTGSAGSKRS